MNVREHRNEHVNEVVADIEKDLRYISGIIKQHGREILSNYTITPRNLLPYSGY